MEITFRDFISIAEGKQVGTMYHFTRFQSLVMMLNNKFDLISVQDYVSFTRDYNLSNTKNKNAIAMLDKSNLQGSRNVRISIDGDKLSNRYKIQPKMDIENGITKNSDEKEEAIYKQPVHLDKFIKQIDIVTSEEDKVKEILQDTKYFKNFKFTFIKKYNDLKKV